MNDEYMPTDAEIREQAIWQFDGPAEINAGAAFDRWMVEHDAHIAADTLTAEAKRIRGLTFEHSSSTEMLNQVVRTLERDANFLINGSLCASQKFLLTARRVSVVTSKEARSDEKH